MNQAFNGKIAFIGGGNMAQALIGGLLAQDVKSNRIIIAEPVASLRDSLQQRGLNVTADNRVAVAEADVVVFVLAARAGLSAQDHAEKASRAGHAGFHPEGAIDMDKGRMAELEKIEAHGAENGWVTPMTEEDKAYFAYFRSVFKRYNISPSKATRLEYDFVTRVAESEFYLQKANV